MEEKILGFQLRVDPKQINRWSPSRRATYLLRESVQAPLSVDTSVWPLSRNSEASLRLFVDYGPEPGDAPNGLGVYRLRDVSAVAPADAPGGVILIAITIQEKSFQDIRSKHLIAEVTTSIADLAAIGWRLLGYDVADSWLTSALLNCGFEPHVKLSLAKQFDGNLNYHGLFLRQVEAAEFAAASDFRIAGHAPFLVYGLWAQSGPNDS